MMLVPPHLKMCRKMIGGVLTGKGRACALFQLSDGPAPWAAGRVVGTIGCVVRVLPAQGPGGKRLAEAASERRNDPWTGTFEAL